jgi:hypothetical protein
VLDAAKLAKLDVGAMPICGEDNRLKSMLTDRDIVVKVLAEFLDALRGYCLKIRKNYNQVLVA